MGTTPAVAGTVDVKNESSRSQRNICESSEDRLFEIVFAHLETKL